MSSTAAKLLFKGETVGFSENDIVSIELLLGRSIPKEVIRVWSRLSGCLFGWQNCEAISAMSNLDGSFFSEGFICSDILEVSGEDSVCSNLEDLSTRVPKNHLPFVSDMGGNLVVLKIDEKQIPVYFWDHELNTLYKAFGSLTEFFFSLEVDSQIPADEQAEEKAECFYVNVAALLSA